MNLECNKTRTFLIYRCENQKFTKIVNFKAAYARFLVQNLPQSWL